MPQILQGPSYLVSPKASARHRGGWLASGQVSAFRAGISLKGGWTASGRVSRFRFLVPRHFFASGWVSRSKPSGQSNRREQKAPQRLNRSRVRSNPAIPRSVQRGTTAPMNTSLKGSTKTLTCHFWRRGLQSRGGA